jgi:hypothetical protein
MASQGSYDLRHTPAESARRLALFRYVEANLMRIMAGWLARAPEWESKIELGRQIWEDAEHANRLGERLPELRLSLNRVPPLPRELADFLDLIDQGATDVATLLTGIHRVTKPRLVADLRLFIASTDPIYDQPSILIVQRIIDEELLQMQRAEQLLELLLNTAERRERASAWESELSGRLQSIGGIVTDAFPSPERGGASSRVAPLLLGPPGDAAEELRTRGRLAPPSLVMCARDARWRLIELDEPMPLPPADPVEANMWRWARSSDGEMIAGEQPARDIYEYPDMPWRFHYLLARQIWDETRHAQMSQQRLERLGGRLEPRFAIARERMSVSSGLPLWQRIYLANLTVEAGLLRSFPYARDVLVAEGDLDSAAIIDYFVADEVIHVRIGNDLDAAYFSQGDRRLRAELMQITRAAEAKRIRDELERFRRTDGVPVPGPDPGVASTIPPANQELLRLAGFSEEEARELAHYRGVLYSEGT